MPGIPANYFIFLSARTLQQCDVDQLSGGRRPLILWRVKNPFSHFVQESSPGFALPHCKQMRTFPEGKALHFLKLCFVSQTVVVSTRRLVDALPCLNSPFNRCTLFFQWFFNFRFLLVLFPILLFYISLVLTFTVHCSTFALHVQPVPIFTSIFNWSPLSFPTFQYFLLSLSNGSNSPLQSSRHGICHTSQKWHLFKICLVSAKIFKN